ncbi:MAG: acetyl-CoA C-acyltransferase [Kiritimatiellaeota bacterium]|nr:acetyl-CoA C-acyltransferase [Kiritimatiellota bacterium]
MSKLFIVGAKRTPQGRLLGALAKRSAADLAKEAGRAILKTIDPLELDQVIIGNVISAGQGMNIARQIGVGLGLPLDRPAYTVNMMCASGMQAVILACQAIQAGEASAILCGGTESMSNAPYLLDRARAGYKLGNAVLLDSILRDGLTDTFSGQHMGLITETLAEQYGIDRAAQDTFALQSQQKYAQAQAQGVFADELTPVDNVTQDEHPRPDVTLEKLSAMKPSFKPNGTITAGNASGINDGAAMLVVCNETTMTRKQWTPLARITGWRTIGCDPAQMGLGPVYATRKLCQHLGVNTDCFDAIELNEAFAAQALACIKELHLDADRVNPNGGAIALGHPIGASGARLLVHLAHRIARGKLRKALATLCIGGGMGSAVMLEKA